ncbi:MAG TPA: UDP-N-acetylmuramoyl-L-alanine--D-glutamate ligase, partial [Saprospiraceae bacterium]|nr:UDP-N-acetylmuramoyl-L-alanine--D-glutamate ligase [Saprospiraceae bacterium]
IGMKVVVIGAKESGVGAALLCKQMGYDVLVSDNGPVIEPFRMELERSKIAFEENGHSSGMSDRFDLMVISPGVPSTVPVIRDFTNSGKEVISEIEFAWRHIGDGKVIGITGSNGKSTLSSLIYHVMEELDRDVTLVGNIGYSFAKMIATTRSQYYVCELSSFQLESIVDFRPHVAIITNITPDHLDRYDHSMEKYAAAKFRITENQTSSDVLIINADDPFSMDYFKQVETEAQIKYISSDRISVDSYISGSGKVYDLSNSQLRGRHNRANMAQAIEALEFIGEKQYQIEQNISSFNGLAHRLEYVATVGGVDFINDSKATNVDSVMYALDAMTQPIVWIAGGTDKGNEYNAIMPLVKDKVKHLICLGIDNTKLIDSFHNIVGSIEEAGSAEEAVRKAMKAATPGDVVLLSPACASFDLFKNFEDRGEKFKKAIRKLT